MKFNWQKSNHGIKAVIFLLISLLLVSCETVSYYSQAARGQLSILMSRQSIEGLLAKDGLDLELREKLELVLEIRAFAASELFLPVKDNYASYVDVGREHVVWNVFAAPEFSTSPVNWCYPIAGCVSYRGYFNEAAANRFAELTAADGFDVYTGGVDAYSTLGWFNDSLLSTVINRSDYQLAGLIFHELAHQVAYLPGDTTFNESFATAVEREGLKRWLESQGDVESLTVAEQNRGRQQEFVELVTLYQGYFADLYDTDKSPEEMRQGKVALQNQLRADYKQLKSSWQGYGGYDLWFSNSLNNAQLSTVSAYNDLVPFFLAELQALNGDFVAFYDRVQQLTELGADELSELIQ